MSLEQEGSKSVAMQCMCLCGICFCLPSETYHICILTSEIKDVDLSIRPQETQE
jgi:hypothetical protein